MKLEEIQKQHKTTVYLEKYNIYVGADEDGTCKVYAVRVIASETCPKGELYELRWKQNYKGYLHCTHTYHGKQYMLSYHRVVAEAFVPNLEGKPQVDHINRDKLDNRIGNLRWVTATENNNNKSHLSLLSADERLKRSERRRRYYLNHREASLAKQREYDRRKYCEWADSHGITPQRRKTDRVELAA